MTLKGSTHIYHLIWVTTFLVAVFLNIVYLLLTSGTTDSNDRDNEGLPASSKSCPGIVLVPRSRLTMMMMMLSVSFFLSTWMELLFVLSVIKQISLSLTTIILRLA